MKTNKILTTLAGVMLLAAAMSGCGKEAAPAAAPEAAEKTTYKVGVCQLVQHAALDAATQGFQDALTELLGDAVTFDVQNAQGDSATCATIANTFVANEYDLMLGNATPALQACSTASDTIPIIGTSVTSFEAALDITMDENGCTGMNVTGTNDLAPLDEQASLLMQLCPDAKNVAILYCSAEANSVYQAENIRPCFEEAGLNCELYTFADSNDLQAVAQSAVDASDVLFIPTDNTAASNMGLIDNVARPAKIPVIVGEEGMCQNGGLASLTIEYYGIGHRAGELAYEILVNGADPATMPVENPTTFVPVYNAEIADELGIEMPADFKAL